MKIFPSLISANLLALGQVIAQLDPHVDGYHLDVMDMHFVPNLTWGPAFINAIRSATSLPLHVHLMTDKPLDVVAMLTLKKGDCCFVHYEVINPADLATIVAQLHERGLRAGLAINPTTSVEHIASIVGLFDDVLVMSVQPGFSGQKFIPVFDKIAALVDVIHAQQLSCVLHMDGGINADNMQQIIHYPIDSVGIAHAIFHNDSLIDNIKILRRVI